MCKSHASKAPPLPRPHWPVQQPRSQRLRARIPGVADANFREQKSCLQTMRNFGASEAVRFPGLSAFAAAANQHSS
ncbi:hypothetical protein GW7_10053 [Heterocephalus glaber]|uniref:Uncharacterized protein n=1 Tax=Heterocephalus glaber TaxID=10181 RepID=G5BZ28_HETGA|nr:hypothetical protein GW7_10053 [Heterocephalus glaber]